LIPWYHYIPVPDATRGSGDGIQAEAIEDLLKFLNSDGKMLGSNSGQAIAQQIAANGRKFIEEHLTMKEIEAYWHELLSSYAKLLDFKPSWNKHYIKIIK
jgi:hypothetical protein